jgi:ADP-heptose:LPS heptosyltransferase
MAQNEFDRVMFFTDIPIDLPGIEVVQIPSIKSKEEYSRFMLKELWKHITTDFILTVQHDGYTLNGELFDERLYEYDFAGALWLQNVWVVENHMNGNGGYSWRSKKLLDAVGKDENIKLSHPEDAHLCRTYRTYLEETYGLKWATDEICDGFSYELREPNKQSMGFHGNFHQPYRPTVILSRKAAAGDILLMEPVCRYYAVKGWNVVLDIPIEFYALFKDHYFPIKHISQFDRGRITPEKEICLDHAYEVKSKQNYLKSYFEFCGITDYVLTRPQLYPLVDENTRLFKKYVVLHIDQRINTPERNPLGINWKQVQRHIENLGYTVIQVGSNDSEDCGLRVNTKNNIAFLKYIIAGASAFIGVDSLPSHIAVAYNLPCVLLFGSTNPYCIHADLTNIEVVQGSCNKANCWHIDGSQSGQKCLFTGTDQYLQCCKHSADDIVDAIDRLTKPQA